MAEQMTPRDEFAARAAEGCLERLYSDRLLHHYGGDRHAVAEAIAEGAYLIADAMLARRRLPPTPCGRFRPDEDGGPDAGAVLTALALVLPGTDPAVVAGWSAEQRRLAFDWAWSEYFGGPDRHGTGRKPRPDFIPESWSR